MDVKQEWPFSLRLVWLTGGLVALNEPEDRNVHVRSHVLGRTFFSFSIASYPSLFAALKSLGFLIIGTTFVTDEKQLQGLRAPEFRAAGLRGGWSTWDACQHWRQIMFAASGQREMRLIDVASRIAAGLQHSEMRLYDLALSYSGQLHSHLSRDEPKLYQAFKDTNGPAVYKDIHALFWEMAVLRDVLAEFIAVFCLGRSDATTLSGLLRSLKKSPSSDQIAIEIVRISDHKTSSAWLARFGSYRDCFTHSAPLELASGFAFTIQDLHTLQNGLAVPQIYYALPESPDTLMGNRAQGLLFRSPDEIAAETVRKRERTKEPDALEYLHNCLGQLTDLAERLVSRSPVAPQPMTFGKDDIIGEIKISRE